MPGSVCRAGQPALIRINRPRRIDRRGARRAHAFTPRCHRGPAAATPCVERSRDDARRGPRAGPPSGVPSSGSTYAPAGAASLQRLAIGMLAHQGAPPRGLCRRDARSSGCLLAEALHRRGAAAGMPDHRDARSPGCALSGILGRRVTPPPEYCVALRAAPSERREASAGRPTAIAAAIGRNRERQRFRRSRPSPRSRAITRYPPHTARRPPHVACRPPPAAGREPA